MKIDRDKEFARMEERFPKVDINRSKNKTKTRRPRSHNLIDKHTADQMMSFEIYGIDHPNVRSGKRSPDGELVTMLKNEINTSNISRRDLYSFIGNGPNALFDSENQVYNLEYGLRQRATITLDCTRRWLALLGKELVIEFRPMSE